jgi:hypothetical protein
MHCTTPLCFAMLCSLLAARPSACIARSDATSIPASALAMQQNYTSGPKYHVAGHVLRLVTNGEACVVEHHGGNAETVKLILNLHPPCYFLTWQRPPSRASHAGKDGVPIGSVGDLIAWRYDGAKGAIALAVIGDPAPDTLRSSNLYRLREQQGMHCGSSVQGILLRASEIQLSTKREHAGLFCAELGLEEKDFWLLAHP